MKPALSVIIITKDEEADLPECLESIRALAPEIIVLDNNSQDRTVEIARRYTAHIHNQAFKDFASQKQAALEKASGEWALSIDADERVSPELAEEIQRALLRNPKESGFKIPFEVHFMGRRLRFGGPGTEYHLRLFRRVCGRFKGEVHEGIEVLGTVGRLRGAIRHFPYRDIDEYLSKMEHYTTVAARRRRDRGERFSPLHHLLPAWEFFVRVVLRLGALDGTPGIVWAGLASFHTWIKYLKLRELTLEVRHSRESGNPGKAILDPRLRGGDVNRNVK